MECFDAEMRSVYVTLKVRLLSKGRETQHALVRLEVEVKLLVSRKMRFRGES